MRGLSISRGALLLCNEYKRTRGAFAGAAAVHPDVCAAPVGRAGSAMVGHLTGLELTQAEQFHNVAMETNEDSSSREPLRQ